VERVAQQEEDAQVATRGEVRALVRQIADLQDALDLPATSGPTRTRPDRSAREE